MNTINEYPKVSMILASLLAGALLLGGCTTTGTGGGAAAPAPEVAQAEPEIVDDYDGDGMLLTLDGSSIEAFDACVARMKRHSDPKVFTTFVAAMDYISVYDLNVKGKKEKLIEVLDGMNGYEVIGRVGWETPDPKSSPAKRAPTT